MEEKKYQLGYTGNKKKNYIALLEETKSNGSSRQKMSVYPRITHYSGQKEHQVGFSLVKVFEASKAKSIFTKLAPGEFRLSGLWQYIPSCAEPCVTVMRNHSKALEKIVERLGSKKTGYMLKANHVPVFWGESSVQAFKYDPNLEKKEQMPRYFVRLKAVFNPSGNRFDAVEQLQEPSLKVPPYLKK